jgi:hypothetical protein
MGIELSLDKQSGWQPLKGGVNADIIPRFSKERWGFLIFCSLLISCATPSQRIKEKLTKWKIGLIQKGVIRLYL